jgi:RimJ/RimL family protein N-acetyltransferase
MNLTPFTPPLKTGGCVLVREITPDDRHLIEVGFAHLSDQSKYFRFLTSKQNLTAAELERFTSRNSPDHVAIGAIRDGGPAPEPIGIARYVRLRAPTHGAEIAITIADDHQRTGLGSLLLGVLSKFAHLNGISQFQALVHRRNIPMLGLLKHFGGEQTTLGGADVEVRLPVLHTAAQLRASSVGESVRAACGLAKIA